jgi:hypothetical protein
VEARRTRIYWGCQIAGWVTYNAFWLLPALYADDHSPAIPVSRRLLAYAGGTSISIFWTHLYRLVIRARGWTALSPPRLLPKAVAGSLLLGPAISLSMMPLGLFYDSLSPLRAWLPWAIASAMFSTLLWSTVYFGVHYFERWRQAERDKAALAVAAAEAKLDFLRSQLNPHFLFNCLNSVRALIIEDPARAHTATTALSTLMRYSLQASHLPTVPLDAELDMVKTYLLLETIRFEQRLRCELEIAADTHGVLVPPMLIQSLVENGVKHGIEPLPDGGVIAMAAWLEHGALRVRVTSSGQIVARPGSTAVGLANARERLRLLYGPRASLAMREDAGSVIAELSVPIAGPAA